MCWKFLEKLTLVTAEEVVFTLATDAQCNQCWCCDLHLRHSMLRDAWWNLERLGPGTQLLCCFACQGHPSCNGKHSTRFCQRASVLVSCLTGFLACARKLCFLDLGGQMTICFHPITMLMSWTWWNAAKGRKPWENEWPTPTCTSKSKSLALTALACRPRKGTAWETAADLLQQMSDLATVIVKTGQQSSMWMRLHKPISCESSQLQMILWLDASGSFTFKTCVGKWLHFLHPTSESGTDW